MGEAGSGEEDNGKAEQHGQQPLPLVPDDASEAREPRRIAHIFEGPDKTEEGRPRALRHEQDPGQGANQVVNAGERSSPEEPRPPGSEVLVARLCGRGDQAQHVFRDEESADNIKAGGEHQGVLALHLLHRLRQHDSDSDGRHRVVHDAKHVGRRMGALGIEQAI